MSNTFYKLPFDKRFDQFDYTLDNMSGKSTYCLNTCMGGTNFSNAPVVKSKTYTDDHFSQRYDFNNLKYDSINDTNAIYKKRIDKYSYLDKNIVNQRYSSVESGKDSSVKLSVESKPSKPSNQSKQSNPSKQFTQIDLSKKFSPQEINFKQSSSNQSSSKQPSSNQSSSKQPSSNQSSSKQPSSNQSSSKLPFAKKVEPKSLSKSLGLEKLSLSNSDT
jgi:hypothetical protein